MHKDITLKIERRNLIMQVKKITLFSNSTLNSTNKTKNNQSNYMTELKNTNAVDSFTFKGRKDLPSRFLPGELVSSANKVLERFRVLESPVREAEGVLSKTKSTKEEIKAAEEIVLKGVNYEAPVKGIKEGTVKAYLGQYYDGWELCLDHNEGQGTIRYRIKLDKNFDAITTESEIKMQTQEDLEFIPLKEKNAYDNAIATIKTLLDSLIKGS